MVRTESAGPAHVPECASRNYWCSYSTDTCVAVEVYAGVAQIHLTPAVADPAGTSSLSLYSVHFCSFLSVLCFVDAADVPRCDLEAMLKISLITSIVIFPTKHMNFWY